MNEDSSDPLLRLIGVIGAYAELYPSLGPRIQKATWNANPDLRRKYALLQGLLAKRETDRRQHLSREWKLTATEAKLAIYLADGGSVAGYASLYSVAIGTVRSQLKSVYAKMGINRQGALAPMISKAR